MYVSILFNNINKEEMLHRFARLLKFRKENVSESFSNQSEIFNCKWKPIRRQSLQKLTKSLRVYSVREIKSMPEKNKQELMCIVLKLNKKV